MIRDLSQEGSSWRWGGREGNGLLSTFLTQLANTENIMLTVHKYVQG